MYTWVNFLFACAFIIGLYFILVLLAGLLKRLKFKGRFFIAINNLVDIILQLYEPLAVILIVVLFIMINPWVHGILIAILGAVSYMPIRHYINGRIFLLNNELKEGQRIKIKETSGIIQQISRLGLSMQTQGGLRFFNYSTIFAEGYTLLKGERVGQLHKIRLHLTESTEDDHKHIIDEKLQVCPYIDWSIKPKVDYEETKEKILISQLLVREEKHLGYLTQLIKEWGYECSLEK